MTGPARRALLALVAIAGVPPASCDYFEPDVGGPVSARCANTDRDPETEVSFSGDIVPLIRRDIGGCIGCHDPTASNPLGVTLGGLDLTTHAKLMQGGARSGGTIVIPGAPCSSVLFLKISAGPPFGERMPANGPPFLTPSEIDRVHDWIVEGALDN